MNTSKATTKQLIKKIRRNALTQEEIEMLCIFSIKYYLSNPEYNETIHIDELIELINRYSESQKIITMWDILECMIDHNSIFNCIEKENRMIYTSDIIGLLTIMETYKTNDEIEFYEMLKALNVYSFITSPLINDKDLKHYKSDIFKRVFEIAKEFTNKLYRIDEDENIDLIFDI